MGDEKSDERENDFTERIWTEEEADEGSKEHKGQANERQRREGNVEVGGGEEDEEENRKRKPARDLETRTGQGVTSVRLALAHLDLQAPRAAI